MNLPTIQDLYADTEMVQKQNDLMVLLNQPPSEKWIKKLTMNGKEVTRIDDNGKYVPVRYIPVERVEWLMSRIFKQWKVEVRQVQIIGNSVCITVRVHYRDLLTGNWEWTEGVGASPLQTNKGAGATDFNALKSAAVQMAAPAAKSYAFKDACEGLGKLFGKDLNRRDIDYTMLLKKEVQDEKLEEVHG